MDNIELYLEEAQPTLCERIEIAGLFTRNPIAHKWKVTFRCLVIRELVAWRFFDLLKQAVELEKREHILGARILLRSAIETLALLIYTNQKMENIVNTGVGFHEFCKKTEPLLAGSRNQSTKLESISILTILDTCDKRYPGLKTIYDDLSESAHPNWQSLMNGYSETDRDSFEVNFKNCWSKNFGGSLEILLSLFLNTFQGEYNELWPENFRNFEKWIEKNNEELEKTKAD